MCFLYFFFSKNTLDSTIIFRKNDIPKEFQFHNSFHETWNIASGTPAHHDLFEWWLWSDLDLFYGKVKFGNNMTLALAVFEKNKLKLAYSAKQQVAQRGNNCSPESQLCHENILNSSQVSKSVFMPPTSKKLRRHIIMLPTSKKFRRHISLGLSVCPSVQELHLHSVKNR